MVIKMRCFFKDLSTGNNSQWLEYTSKTTSQYNKNIRVIKVTNSIISYQDNGYDIPYSNNDRKIMPNAVKEKDIFKDRFVELTLDQKIQLFQMFADVDTFAEQRTTLLIWALETLKEEEQSKLIADINYRLTKLITSINALLDVLNVLNADRAIEDVVKFTAEKVITQEEELADTLAGLPDNKKQLVFNAIKSKLPELITNGAKLTDILKFFKQPQLKKDVIATIKHKLTELIDTIDTQETLNCMLPHLTQEQKNSLAKKFKTSFISKQDLKDQLKRYKTHSYLRMFLSFFCIMSTKSPCIRLLEELIRHLNDTDVISEKDIKYILPRQYTSIFTTSISRNQNDNSGTQEVNLNTRETIAAIAKKFT